MANGHGGPRTPEHPAPASGPGALSKRTDGGPAQKMRQMTGLPYGDASALNSQQHGAPMAAADTVKTPPIDVPAGPAGGDAPMPAFNRPSDNPGQPITHGAALGPGPGPAFALPPTGQDAAPQGYLTQRLRDLSARDATGALAQLYEAAMTRGV